MGVVTSTPVVDVGKPIVHTTMAVKQYKYFIMGYHR